MAGRIPESAVDEVLARTDLRSVIEPYVQLKRKGGRFFGLCPFHNEKTPSFSVSPDSALFYCFGCGEGGSAIQFLMRVETWTFQEAVRELARRAGVRLPEAEDRGERTSREDKETYFKLLESACRFYEQQLSGGLSPAAIAYLRQRGVDEQTQVRFRLGYAADDWTGLLGAMRRNSVAPPAVERAGLALARKAGDGYYDRFRDRIMFPVVDRLSRVVGFSGRALGEVDGQKYINSPELAFFKKGEHLYGIHAAKEALRKRREALVVEGNFDVVTLHAAGFQTAVAPMGTALTTRQVSLLRRISDSVVIAFDGDEAGRRAMLKVLGPCYQVELPVRACVLPDGADPDSFVRDRGAQAFEALLERARPLAEVALDDVVTPVLGDAPEYRARAARAAGDLLAQMPKGPIRRGYQEDVARRLEVAVDDVRPARTSRSKAAPARDPLVMERLTPRDGQLVQLLVDEPNLAHDLCLEPEFETFVRPALQPFVRLLAEASLSDEAVRIERVVEQLDEAVRGPIVHAIASERDYTPERREAVRRTLRSLRERGVKRRQRQLIEELRRVEQSGDVARQIELLKEARDLEGQLSELSQ